MGKHLWKPIVKWEKKIRYGISHQIIYYSKEKKNLSLLVLISLSLIQIFQSDGQNMVYKWMWLAKLNFFGLN